MEYQQIRNITVLGLCAVVAQAASVQAQSVEKFYKSHNMTMFVTGSPAGGYTAYSRLLARGMKKYIPGNPSIIVKHKQGAQGLLAANYLYNKAPRDGTEIASVHREAVSTGPLFDSKGVRFKPDEFSWVGSMNSSTQVMVTWHTSGVKTFQDLRTKGVVMGATGVKTIGVQLALFLNNEMGTKIKLIRGYPQGPQVNLAMEKKEVLGRGGWSWSSVKNTQPGWIRDKKVNFLIQIGVRKNPELTAMGVPLILDLAKSERQKSMLRLMFASLGMGRPYLGPPAIPAARLKAQRAAFNAALKDKEFLRRATKAKLDIVLVTGEEIETMLKKIYATPKSLIEETTRAMNDPRLTEITVKKIPWVTVKSTVTKIQRKGRRISFKVKGKTHRVNVSGRRSKVTIGGKKAKRGKIKVGMSCAFTYQGNKTLAKAINCG
jgi:tripartite-type tricarboxylate transporter receptor subunit TctC